MYRENLKLLRHELRITTQQFAEAVGVAANSINNYENGRRKPNFEFMELLLNVYNVNLNWFVSGKGHMFNEQNKTDLNQIDEDKIRAFCISLLASVIITFVIILYNICKSFLIFCT